MKNIDIQQLRTFRAVSATGSMTQASSLLNLTQGAVSQQIKKLEEQLSCQLFERLKEGMKLTPAGERLFSRSKDMISLNDQIWSEMTKPEFEGELTLGIPLDLVYAPLPNILRQFSEQFPNVNITLTAGNTLHLKRLFRDGKLDITLMEEVETSVTGEPICKDQLVWITAPSSNILKADPLPISIASADCVFQAPTITALDNADRKWKRVYESNNIEAVQAMVRMDMAVGVFLKSLVPTTLDWFETAEGFPPLPEFYVSLAVAEGPQRPLALQLASFLHRGFNLKRAV
ncbi:MAG: LysR family transcriptional regulator [Sneathiella sp.]|nr:LysR family transcriptional regulator [Sneathiella sp.]